MGGERKGGAGEGWERAGKEGRIASWLLGGCTPLIIGKCSYVFSDSKQGPSLLLIVINSSQFNEYMFIFS